MSIVRTFSGKNWNPVEIWYTLFVTLPKKTGSIFIWQHYIYPPSTSFKGGLFVHLFGGSFMIADFCNMLLQIRTGKRTSVFYADESDCKTKCTRQFRSSVLHMYEILCDTTPPFWKLRKTIPLLHYRAAFKAERPIVWFLHFSANEKTLLTYTEFRNHCETSNSLVSLLT